VASVLIVAGVGSALFSPTWSSGSPDESEDIVQKDTSAIRAVVDSYHEALESGDREAAMELLSPDVMVLEGGHLETAGEYLSHHLQADMAFSAAVTNQREVAQTHVEANVGWVISTSSSKGEFHGRQIDAAGVELMILHKEDGKWRIRAIHWSSRNRDK
jgi:uncharacterized protein (TIGR02246 family)